jgi:2'-5' RNA ligase
VSGRTGTVTAVVCAAFDEATDAAIYAVRDRVRAAGVPLPERPPHRPHFSLAAARVSRGAELDRLTALAARVAREHRPIPLSLREVGRFGRAGVIWLGPGSSPPLARLQHDVHLALERAGWPSAFGERSAPAQWVAHCTLATRIPKPQLRGLQAELAAAYAPIDARVDALATILVGGRGDVAHALLGDDDGRGAPVQFAP